MNEFDKISVDWLDECTVMTREPNKVSDFSHTFMINWLQTKVKFNVETKGCAMVFIYQGEKFEEKLFLGLIKTKQEAEQIYLTISRGLSLLSTVDNTVTKIQETANKLGFEFTTEHAQQMYLTLNE